MKPKVNVKELIRFGYRRTSNAYGLVSRIDRPDWREAMAASHSPWNPADGMKWVECLEKQPGSAEDHYRRCHSKDTLELGASLGRQIPTSNFDTTGFVPKPLPISCKHCKGTWKEGRATRLCPHCGREAR